MITKTNKNFNKQYAKLQETIKTKFKQRRNLFLIDPFHPQLNNHPLHKEWAGCRSIDVTGDYRAIYYHLSEDLIVFIAIGTHSQLYG